MSKKEPTRDDMLKELLAALALLRTYPVKVQLKVVGEDCRIRLSIPPERAPHAEVKAAKNPVRRTRTPRATSDGKAGVRRVTLDPRSTAPG